MIQQKTSITRKRSSRLSYWYDRMHGLVREDIEKVNAMVEHIEKTRSDWYPRTGDSLFLISGYGERSPPFFVDAVYGDNIVLRNFPCPVRVPGIRGIKYDAWRWVCVGKDRRCKVQDLDYRPFQALGTLRDMWKQGKFTTMRK